MLHLMLLNECLLQYFSFMCVTMMVFSVCVNDCAPSIYMLIFKWFVMRFGSSCDFLITTCFWWLSVYYKVTE